MKMVENEDGTIEFQATKKSKWFYRWGLKWLCAIPLLAVVLVLISKLVSTSYQRYDDFGDMLMYTGLFFVAGWMVSKFKMAQAHRTFYRLTKYGIEIRTGVMHEEVITVPWQAVRMVKVFRTDADLIMKQGQIHVECAGDNYPEIKFKGLDNWDEVKGLLLERMALR